MQTQTDLNQLSAIAARLREMREILGDVSFQEPEISQYIRDYLRENEAEVTRGRLI